MRIEIIVSGARIEVKENFGEWLSMIQDGCVRTRDPSSRW
jgi:hypothetical protein